MSDSGPQGPRVFIVSSETDKKQDIETLLVQYDWYWFWYEVGGVDGSRVN